MGSSYFRSTFSSQNNKNFRTDRGDAPSELAEFCANYAQFYSKTLKQQFYESKKYSTFKVSLISLLILRIQKVIKFILLTKPTKLDYWSIFVLYASFWCWYNDFNIWKKSKRFFYFIFFLTLKWEMRWRRVCKNAFIEEGLSSIWKTISFFHFILTKWQIDKIAQIARAVTLLNFQSCFLCYKIELKWRH